MEIQKKIAEALSKIAPDVEESIVDAVVEREVNKRSEAVVAVMDLIYRAEKDLKKIKPDLISYDEEGKLQAEAYSKAKIEERSKLSSRLDKMKKAVEKALTDGDFSDVYGFQSSGKSEG